MKKRAISTILALVTALSLLPAALAQGEDEALEATALTPEPASQTSFDDVAPNAWYHDAVIYVYDHGIMNGTKKNHTRFSPEVTMSRAMLMTVLARYDGVDTTGGNTWFVKGQGWAVKKGVSNGVTPDADVTREQLVTMLWRYVGQPKTTENLNGFPDAGKASRYAQTALQWAVEEGLIEGKKNGLLEPKASASRAEVAAVLMRFCEKYDFERFDTEEPDAEKADAKQDNVEKGAAEKESAEQDSTKKQDAKD